jgi:conjugative relaxase-like TrwC/TraI family protein
MDNHMMSISNALTAAQTEQYFDEHYSHDDYYTQGQRTVGQWVGKGAADLSLAGDVGREDFSALLKGIDPHSGAVIIPAATHNGEHRAGWDSQFSAPKSVSIQALVGGDGRLIEAHRQAVATALREVEGYALAWQHGGKERIATNNVIGASFLHVAARPSENARFGPDPQLHTHVVLLNMTRRPDGEWRGLEPMKIFGAQQLGSAVYQSELAREVQRLGYQIQIVSPSGKWELDGYSRDQIMAFSQRRQDIERLMDERGWHGARAAQQVALETRLAKNGQDEATLKSEWQQRAAVYGIDAKQHLWSALGHADMNRGTADDSREALDFATCHTTNREAVIDRWELETAALRHGMGRVDLATVRQAMASDEQRGTLIRLENKDWFHPQGAFTTRDVLTMENENIELMRARCNTLVEPVAKHDEVQRWAEGKRLSTEQIAACQLALSSDKSIMAVEGLAGAAKTTTVGAIREFAENHNYIVRGFAMTTTARKALREAGIKAETIASLLNHPPSPTGPEIWFVDESSLVSSEKANRILKIAREAGIERLNFVGDQGQHQSIEAGAPLRQFLKEGMPIAALQEIRRQQDPKLRNAVRVARDDGRAAFDLLQEQGRITEIPDIQRRYRQIAADYLAGVEAKQQTLVVSPGNDERKDLNREIRALLVERGHVKQRGIEHQVLVRRDLTPAQIAHFGSYQECDVIRISGNRAQQRQGLKRDSYVTVEAVNHDRKFLILRAEDGQKLELSPIRWRDGDQVAAEVYTAERRVLAAGDCIQFRRPDNRRDIANGEFATILSIGSHQARIRFEGKGQRELTLPLDALRHIDYGYTVTSFSSQGSTVDKVIVNDDSMRGARLVNREQEYVSVSRARIDARIYTDDAEALRRAVSRDPKKESALEAIKQQPMQQITPQQTQVSSINLGI